VSYAVRCARCQRPIGIYEPTVMINDDGAWRTSRAIQRGLGMNDERLLHLACFETLEAENVEVADAAG
jgi:hypothetical protein